MMRLRMKPMFRSTFRVYPISLMIPTWPIIPSWIREGNGSFYQGINFVYVGATVPGFPIAPLQTARDGRLGSRMIRTDWLDFAPQDWRGLQPQLQMGIADRLRHFL